MEHMYDILKPGGEILLVFLASNPIFTMYERMAERTEWAEYMKVYLSLLPSITYYLRVYYSFRFHFRTLTNTYPITNTLLDRLKCFPLLAVPLDSK